MVAARFANLPQGRPKGVEGKGANSPPSNTTKEAAALLNVGERTVKDARAVPASGDAETIAKLPEHEGGALSPARGVWLECAAAPLQREKHDSVLRVAAVGRHRKTQAII